MRYFWAFVVAVVLFSLGGLFSVYEGYHKIHDPHEIDSPAIAIGILVVAFVFEAFALRTAVRHATPARGKRSWPEYVRESRTPELPVLLLEDSGALLGLVVRAAGHRARADHRRAGLRRHRHAGHRPPAARDRVRPGEGDAQPADRRVRRAGAGGEDRRRARARSGRAPGHPHAHEHIGPDEILIAAKVEFDPGLTVAQLVDAINAAEARVRAIAGIGTARIYIEPDVGPPETVAQAAAPRP